MKMTPSTYALTAAALLGVGMAAGISAGEPPRGDAAHGGMMHDELRADADGDGRVSRAEATESAAKRANEWFDQLDANKDGFVTQEETSQARASRRENFRGKMDEHFKAADGNGDGQLSLDEVQAKMPRVAERFSVLDKDKNGMLSKEELHRGGPHPQPQS